MKNFNQFINENIKENESVDNIILFIDSFPKKMKINKPYQLYSDGIESAISNSEITSFYEKYQREKFKKYIKSIPFPFEKLTSDNVERFNKLNEIAKIYKKYEDVHMKLIEHVCLHLMDVILYDMYFDIKPQRFNVYEKIDELIIPDEKNVNDCKKFGRWFANKENPFNYIIFFSNAITHDSVMYKIRHY